MRHPLRHQKPSLTQETKMPRSRPVGLAGHRHLWPCGINDGNVDDYGNDNNDYDEDDGDVDKGEDEDDVSDYDLEYL